MKWDVGFEEGAVCGPEEGVPSGCSTEETCSIEVDGLAISFATALVIETLGGTRVIWLRDLCRNFGADAAKPSLNADFGGTTAVGGGRAGETGGMGGGKSG